MLLKRPYSLRIRLFISMMVLVLISAIVIATITAYRYKNEAELYHQSRLERKERSIKRHINYILRRTTYPVNTKNIPLIFKENGRIYELSEIHRMPLIIYDLEGGLMLKSNESFTKDTLQQYIPKGVISRIRNSTDKSHLVSYEREGERFKSLYTYITDNKFKPLAILNLPYVENDDLVKKDIRAFIKSLAEVYVLMLVLCVIVAFVLSNFITGSIKSISDKIKDTRLGLSNKKIIVDNVSEEIETLVRAYNSMTDQLEASAIKLARSERENAWKEMARQVAHEIKNPLTPMRLTIQSFERRFDPNDPNIKMKLGEYSETLIQQIDTMSTIASAFSDFAKMPKRKDEILDLNDVVDSVIDIFPEQGVSFNPSSQLIHINFDKLQLVRVVTNLVKNALQAIPANTRAKILISTRTFEQKAIIEIEDNGTGIETENRDKIFEPNFTTKSSGMGLGLAMVKSIIETYEGTISFESTIGAGTTFKVEIPLSNHK